LGEPPSTLTTSVIFSTVLSSAVSLRSGTAADVELPRYFCPAGAIADRGEALRQQDGGSWPLALPRRAKLLPRRLQSRRYRGRRR
jgi:hypothetical protein